MATFYLDPVAPGGGDGSEGTPFSSWQAAVSAMSAGDTLNVLGGIFDAPLSGIPSGTNSSSRTKVCGTPGSSFIITGGVSLGLMGACVASDEQYVGSNWDKIYKTTVSKSLFPNSDPYSAALCENGEQLTLVVERADRSDTFFLEWNIHYHTADVSEVVNGNVVSFKKTSVTDLYTKAQLENSRCYFIQNPNVSVNAGIIFDDVNDTIDLIGGPYVYEDSAVKDNFALFNLLPAMVQGEWGFRDLGNGDCVLYVWPFSTANITNQLIEYSSAAIGLDLNGTNHVEVCNFAIRQIACPVRTGSGAVYAKTSTAGGLTDMYLHDFEIRNCSTLDRAAAIRLQGVDNLWMHDFKVERMRGGVGFFLQGNGAADADWPRIGFSAGSAVSDGATIVGATSGASATILFQQRQAGDLGLGTAEGFFCYEPGNLTGTFQEGETLNVGGSPVANYLGARSDFTNPGDASAVGHAVNAHVHDFELNYIEASPIIAYTQRNCAVHHGWIHNCGRRTHSNTVDFYQGCHNFLWWGINAEESDGYWTWQEGDSHVMAFCSASASTAPNGGARAIEEQQNRFSELPGTAFGWLGSYILNNRGIANPDKITDARYGNGLNVSSSYAPLNLYTVYNNIHHGSSSESGAALADWNHNLNTKGSGSGSELRGPNDVSADWSTVYNDAQNDDFTYQEGALVFSFAALDWSSLITGFKARWPLVNTHATLLGIPDPFTLDMVKDTINWDTPPIGPTVNLLADYRTNTSSTPAPTTPSITAGLVTISLVSPV